MEVYRIPAYFGILIDYNIYCVENIAMNCQITIMIKNNIPLRYFELNLAHHFAHIMYTVYLTILLFILFLYNILYNAPTSA